MCMRVGMHLWFMHVCYYVYANDTELQMCGCMGIGHVEVNAL